MFLLTNLHTLDIPRDKDCNIANWIEISDGHISAHSGKHFKQWKSFMYENIIVKCWHVRKDVHKKDRKLLNWNWWNNKWYSFYHMFSCIRVHELNNAIFSYWKLKQSKVFIRFEFQHYLMIVFYTSSSGIVNELRILSKGLFFRSSIIFGITLKPLERNPAQNE